MGEGAVVGEEEETFAGVVEAADGIDALGERAEELHDGGTALGITDGCDVAFGFVEHEVEEALGWLDGFAVDGDGVGVGIGFGAEFGDDLAVECNAAGGDDFFGFAARGDAGGGEDFLEALLHWRGHFTMRFGWVRGKRKDNEARSARRSRREEAEGRKIRSCAFDRDWVTGLPRSLHSAARRPINRREEKIGPLRSG